MAFIILVKGGMFASAFACALAGTPRCFPHGETSHPMVDCSTFKCFKDLKRVTDTYYISNLNICTISNTLQVQRNNPKETFFYYFNYYLISISVIGKTKQKQKKKTAHDLLKYNKFHYIQRKPDKQERKFPVK